MRCRGVVAGVAVAIAIPAWGSTGASAAPSLHCEASAARASVGGQAAIEPSVVGRDAPCATASATPALSLPGLVDAQALTASTAFDGASATGAATGGVAQLRVLPTPDLIAQLPTEQFIDNLPAITVPLGVIPGVPVTSIQIDVRDALRAAVPTPGTALLSADLLTARAAVACQGGGAVMSGSSELTGLELLGRPVGVDGALEQSLNLIDSRSIKLSDLDLSKIHIVTPLGPLPLAIIQGQLATLLAPLPAIPLPASVILARLTANEQVADGATLTQRALRAQLSLLGQPVLDAVFGEAKVGAAAGTCAAPVITAIPARPAAKPSTPAAGAAQGGVADQLLACTDRKLVLVDVLEQGSRVKLLGAANRDYVGRSVAIRLRATGKVVAHAVVRKDGSFQTYAPAPPRAMMATHQRANSVRYRAEIGRELSLPLKLRRRLIVSSLTSKGGKVTIAGRVVRPLTTPVSTIRLVRRVSCHEVVLVKRFKPRADGTFRVTVSAPKGQAAAVYRMVTRVREKPSNPRTYPTFTLPRGVALTTR